ncbi:hypothetical protein [Methylosinus trichosporium]|uniref:Uncharacterized protein n=1 Tax=Methylosinus trichosporium (strain ATCC 35070 / NCIMB 11131 / UNIQEM 75 / OB3b) TaxID=595536 RepID=A0A2D2D260_METT3|nr:hypothetical protein [Methylosinus trichosporium]ATQ69091.1 hypothetical protein CQW49_15310 [Methylosinus trichosporium OB3b]OBS51887.1 hypothetical protein A8B73_13735 [Methylosinus sp. 3S-1]
MRISANFVIVGRRLIPREHIAFVESYDASANPRFQTSRDFQGRVVMVNRDSILIEETPQAFAEASGFRMLPIDKVATNPLVHFRVETFVPAEGFTPAKAYATRLLWRDLDGNDQSRLLLSDPETVLAIAVTGEAPAPPSQTTRRGTPRKRARQSGQRAPNP